MNIPLTASINSKCHLEIGGVDVLELVKKYGTPLYVIDEEDIRARCRNYKETFRQVYPNTEFIFASKALSAVGIIKIIASEGFGMDVVSGGELYTALKAKVKPQKIYFHGNNKSMQEMTEGIRAGVGHFVIDNFDEIRKLDGLTRKLKKKINVLIRVNPGVEAHTHDAVKTGQTDSKFGISKARIMEAINLINAAKNLNFVGLHAHIGSQIFDAKGYQSEIEVLTDLMKEIKDKMNIDVLELNIGGGVGVAYVDGDDPVKMKDLAKAIAEKLKERISKYKLCEPKLILEPGRSIVARAGVTLYSVGHVKEIQGLRKYVIVDGGMSDNIRPMLYGAKYDFAIANEMKETRSEKVTIAGRFCESGDVLAKDIMMPKVNEGDVIAVFVTGAYNYSMASNYNRFPKPAMVSVKKGKARLIIKRETYKDITRNDVV
jgi:diaminopimelate decarboxylase